MLTKPFLRHIEAVLSKVKGEHSNITKFSPVSGGSINTAFRLQTTTGNFFLKFNSSSRFPGMFENEIKGLSLLHKTGAVKIPEVICAGEFESNDFLILDMINQTSSTAKSQEKLGKQLAHLHKIEAETFGLDHDNYIGSLPQSNTQMLSGIDFMIQMRYLPLVHNAATKKLLPVNVARQFDNFYKVFPELFPREKPVLLHGDLWGGNYITGNDGTSWLIDPAVYFGFRETDIAMTRLFGGFSEAFYASYQNSNPMAKGWEKRVELFQLYPILVHLNLFGTGYLDGVKGILAKYT